MLLDNKKQKGSCNPLLFKAISDMFGNADPEILKTANLAEPLRKLLTSYCDVSATLDISETSDVEY